jgi:hypothetical protein
MAFDGLVVTCCGEAGQDMDGNNLCVCGAEERVLRAYMRNDSKLGSMNAEDREWCLGEIAQVEGYDRKDYESCNDAQLARGVLNAWRDYCRDIGLL